MAMKTRRTLVTLFLLGWLLPAFSSGAQAQELRKTLDDYHRARPIQYGPSDPWTRSKLFQVHTNHYGWFYNCDDEECKRNSPYICWKLHHEEDIPNHMTCLERIRHEVRQVKQRIIDGAGMCAPGCACQQCRQAPVADTGGCPCPACSGHPAPMLEEMPAEMYLGKREATSSQRQSSQVAKQPPAVAQRQVAAPTAGLISRRTSSLAPPVEKAGEGNNVASQPVAAPTNQRFVVRTTGNRPVDSQVRQPAKPQAGDAPAHVAERSEGLLDRLRAVRR